MEDKIKELEKLEKLLNEIGSSYILAGNHSTKGNIARSAEIILENSKKEQELIDMYNELLPKENEFKWHKVKLDRRNDIFYGEVNNWFYFENNDTSKDLYRVRNAHIIEALNEKIGCKSPVLCIFL